MLLLKDNKVWGFVYLNKLFNLFIDAHGGEILQTVKIKAEIKKVALTLYLGGTKLVSFLKILFTLL